jgi:hypothetical protein
VGLRQPRGSFQLATKVSADGAVRARIALETGTRFGTSGTFPWLPIRFALQTPDEQICITDEAALAAAYRIPTRHNCADVLELTIDGRRYRLLAPDTRVPIRTVATLSVFAGASLERGPLSLATTSCTSHLPSAPCLSGGPC